MGDGPASGVQCVLDSAVHMGMVIVMQHSNTPHEYANVPSCNGSMNISRGFHINAMYALMLMLGYLNVNMNSQHQGTGPIWMDSTPGM